MIEDVQAVAEFYARRDGQLAARLLRRRLQAVWPELRGRTVLGLGHTAPFLTLWQDQAHACIDAGTGSASTMAGRPAGCLVQDDCLPFADNSIDRVLLVHAVENAARINGMLRAVWRVLRDDGRLLVVVPNRTGVWAHIETTPFADGAPCSTGRIRRILARSLFRIERLHGALWAPPGRLGPLLRIGSRLESAGRHLTPRLAGVLVVEAVKDLYAPIPIATASGARPARRRLVLSMGTAARREPDTRRRAPHGAAEANTPSV